MPKKSYRQAINEAIRQEMERDHRVIIMGEDVAGGAGAPGEQDAWGGPMGVTKGLMPQFGRDRVLDTPISESAFIGAAIGAAATGLRLIADLMFVDFMGVCFDQIFNQAAKFRYMFGGKAVTPVVIRTMYGAGFRAASQHSQCLYPLFTHIPGLKVVAHPRCSIATDIAALIADQAFASLKAPIKMVTAPHTPVPFSPALEDLYVPSVAKIEAAVQEAMGYSRAAAAE